MPDDEERRCSTTATSTATDDGRTTDERTGQHARRTEHAAGRRADQIVTTLTGGDPGRFCPTITDVLASVTAYAEAVLTEPASDVGLSDLAFAPYLVRALTPYLEAAPIELFERADPLRQRAEQAVQALGAARTRRSGRRRAGDAGR